MLGYCWNQFINYVGVVYTRALFADAETEEKKMGINSALHIIILDEIDAICRQRGSLVGIYSLCSLV